MTTKPDMVPAAATRTGTRARVLYAALALVVIVADQVTKALVARVIPEHGVIPVIPGFLNLTHTKNPGVAFGLFSGSPAPWKTALLVIISAALLAMVIYLVWQSRELHWASGLGLALILGGALSNLADRIRVARVIDFIDAYFRSFHWYTFNLADSAIVVGAVFLVFHQLISD